MHRDEFVAMLDTEQFRELATVQREPGGFLDAHAHAFEAKALILKGELTIRTESLECTYRAGDIFHLAADVIHNERYGPEGVEYLVGRKVAPAR